MRVLITGKNGQVGSELTKSVPKEVELFAFGHSELDITSEDELSKIIHELEPDYLINTAAYTAVDRAEKDQEKVYLTNATAVEYLAKLARKISARLIHLSTDFVFDGTQSLPYLPNDSLNPLSAYGKSKAEGEQNVQKYYAANSIILRTSWVYSTTGNNFVKSMLNSMKERDELRIVKDQIGAPTWSKNLAVTIWAMVSNNVHAGIYHWSDSGLASWYDFAVAIYEEANAINLIDRPLNIIPISTSQYSTPAIRPVYSVLDVSQTNKIWGVQQEHWRSALRKMLLDHKKLIQISDELTK